MTAAPRPGWYPDPAGHHDQSTAGFRWWDGSDWTDDLADSPRSPAPSVPRARHTPLRRVVALVVALALFVGASVSFGLLLWGESRPVRSGAPTGATDAAAADPPGRLDLHTRVAAIGPASLRLPPDPYTLIEDPRHVAGLFDVFFMANAPVHERYDGARTWTATVLLARLSASVGGSGLEVRGQNALERISTSFFDGHPTELVEVRWSDRTVSSCTGVLMTGRVEYGVAGLPSRFDNLTAQIVELADDTVVVAATSVPDDTPPAVAAQAGEALSSLAVA